MTPRRHLVSAALAVLVTVASVALVLLALDQAIGERANPDGSCCEVEFIDYRILQLTWLLFPLLGVAAAFSVRVSLVALLGMTVPQWLAMNEVIARYDRSGWGDGLEMLGYAVPLGVLALGVVTVLVGGLVGRSRRARGHDQ